jgi:hypothetical protein
MSKPRKGKKPKKSRTMLSVTPLAKHRKIGKDVVPPMAELLRQVNAHRGDWSGERLPEMLWAAMLLVTVGRDKTLSRFHRLAEYLCDRCREDESRKLILRYVSLSGLEKWSDEDWQQFVSIIIGDEKEVFSDLLRFDNLPGKERWFAVAPPSKVDDFELLKHALAATLWHQTQEATDCRWMKVMAAVVTGAMVLPSEELWKEITEYPTYGDMRAVRPMIRANEGSIDMMSPSSPSSWAPRFWQQAYDLTKNDHAAFSPAPAVATSRATLDDVRRVRVALIEHAHQTTVGTNVDPRHEASFGFACYALTIMAEMLAAENAFGINGRDLLRSLTETLITFSSLAKNDDPKLWQRFRDYGYGQAKLTYLKMLETATLPGFITIESIEGLSNEDTWHEFREIHIGNWADSDLRKMSEAAGIKADVYDPYYDWSSAFVHGNWAAIRDACYDVCLNPLHRLHRVLAAEPKKLSNVCDDGVQLVNRILLAMDGLYPTFSERLPEPPRVSAPRTSDQPAGS